MSHMIAWAVCVTVATALVGLVVRRRVSACYPFAAYLSAVLVADLMVILWPDRFFRQWFWIAKELVFVCFRFAIALDLTYRTFRAFPGARATARGLVFLALTLTLVAVFAATQDLTPSLGAAPLSPFVSRVQPRVLNGTIWLLTAIAALIVWYRLPVHPFHKAILSGFVPYLLVAATSLSLIESHGWGIQVQVDYLQTTVYLLTMAYWTRAAWRKDEATVRVLEPARSLETVVG